VIALAPQLTGYPEVILAISCQQWLPGKVTGLKSWQLEVRKPCDFELL
jgi:hypothetical protein